MDKTLPKGATSVVVPRWDKFTVEDLTDSPMLAFRKVGECKEHPNCQVGYWEVPSLSIVETRREIHGKVDSKGDIEE